MIKKTEEKLMEEHKFITKCIFNGLTIAQIAERLNYSQSTVSNRLNSLFEKYCAKTRFDFILAVFSEIFEQNKQKVDKLDLAIKCLLEEKQQMVNILSKIVENKDEQNARSFWIKQAKSFLEK